MRRSRGGLTAKIHAVADANGNPIALKLSEGQAHDGRSAADLPDSVKAGQILLADRGYDSDAWRAAMAAFSAALLSPGLAGSRCKAAFLQPGCRKAAVPLDFRGGRSNSRSPSPPHQGSPARNRSTGGSDPRGSSSNGTCPSPGSRTSAACGMSRR